MRQFVLATLVICFALVAPMQTSAQDNAQNQTQVLAAIQKQLTQMQGQMENLRDENRELRQALQDQQNGQQNAEQNFEQEGGSVYHQPRNIFAEEVGPFYVRPGAHHPSYIDILVEHNRQITMDAWARLRENQRLADQRRGRIAAESKAMGALFVPRELRDAILAGEDPKASRENLVEARDTDFNSLIGQPSVKNYLEEKANRIQGQVVSHDGVASESMHGAVGQPSDEVRRIANRMKRDHNDAIVLFGSDGQVGGLDLATELTKQRRDSTNVLVSGPTRDQLRDAGRADVVETAITHEVDVEMVLRQQAIAKANQSMRRRPVQIYSAGDLGQVNRVLNGKVSRTGVPQVHAIIERRQPQH